VCCCAGLRPATGRSARSDRTSARPRRVPVSETTKQIVPAQAWTRSSFVLMATGIGAGFIIAALWR
jgi:hypothetical protein